MTESGPPAVAVVVPAWRAGPALARAIDALLAQDPGVAFEVVVVVSGDTDAELADSDRLDRPIAGSDSGDREAPAGLVVVRHRGRLSASQGRNLGVAHSAAGLLAFTDADAVAAPGWLAALVAAAAAGEGQVAAGAVANGTPKSAAGTTEYLVEFLDLHPGRPPGSVWHGASANLAMPRDLYERFGPFADASAATRAVGSGDTLLTMAAAQAGRFCFVPDAVITHENRTSLRRVLVHQYDLGLAMSGLARRSPHLRYRRLLTRTWAAPLLAAGRLVSLWRRVLTWRLGLVGRTAALSAHLVAALAAWGAGLAVGNHRLAAARRRRGHG